MRLIIPYGHYIVFNCSAIFIPYFLGSACFNLLYFLWVELPLNPPICFKYVWKIFPKQLTICFLLLYMIKKNKFSFYRKLLLKNHKAWLFSFFGCQMTSTFKNHKNKTECKSFAQIFFAETTTQQKMGCRKYKEGSVMRSRNWLKQLCYFC